jgi:hypothetical protein
MAAIPAMREAVFISGSVREHLKFTTFTRADVNGLIEVGDIIDIPRMASENHWIVHRADTVCH